MKYFITALSINEEYFKQTLKFFIELCDKTTDCLLNITTSNKDLDNFETYMGYSLEVFYEKYPKINITTLESFNHNISYDTKIDGYGFTFNVNKLSINSCLFLPILH
jgi:hypothetical protein